MKSETSRLEKWTYLLSKEVVNYWLTNQEIELPPFEKSITLLGLKGEADINQLYQNLEQGEADLTLLEELEKFLQRIEENYSSESNSLEKIWQIESVLFNWYYGNNNDKNSLGCLQKGEIKSRILRVETRKKFQDFIDSLPLKSSPRGQFDYLSRIGALLFNLNDRYEAERQSYILQENGGKKSYDFLISKIIKSPTESEVNNNYKSGINALFHIYKCKIKGEIADLASHIIRGVIQDYQLINDSLIETISFLDNLRESLSLKEQESDLSTLVLFDEMCLVKSPNDLRLEVEEDLGIPLNRWGIVSCISPEQVKEILLGKIRIITQDIHAQLIKKLTSESDSNQEETKPFQLLSYSNSKVKS